MIDMNFTEPFWQTLDELVRTSGVVIDRPKGSRHPRYPDYIYPLDYGYLKNTASMDGGGIDVWVGTAEVTETDAVMVTVDLQKRDVEIKILLSLTEEEKELIFASHNETPNMKGILVRRDKR